jgi:hypothetical protein
LDYARTECFFKESLAECALLEVVYYYDESHGVMRAVNEFASRHDIVIHLSVFGQAFFVYGEQPQQGQATRIGRDEVYLSTAYVAEAPVFLSFLEQVACLREKDAGRLRAFVNFCRSRREIP